MKGVKGVEEGKKTLLVIFNEDSYLGKEQIPHKT